MEKRTEQLIRGLAHFHIELPEDILLRELDFLDELSRWSARINLTAIRNQQEGLEMHLVDSLALLKHCPVGRILDVGSGAGLPAIPLAIAQPERQVYSVESVGKKVNFQKHIRRYLHLSNFEPLNCRVENLVVDTLFPLITARAFAPLDRILGLVHHLLSEGGQLILLRGAKDELGREETSNALNLYGFIVTETVQYQLPFSRAQRQIVKMSRF